MRRTAARHVLALLLTALTAAAGLVIAGPASVAAAYPTKICATIFVSTTVPAQGEAITVTGKNFLPKRDVALVLDPVASNTSGSRVDLTTVRSGADGSFSTKVTLPADATGTYDITAASGSSTYGGVCPADPSARLSIGGDDGGRTPDSNDPGGTAFTGLNVLLLLLVAAGLIGVGVAATRRGRRPVSTHIR